ncbi:MAG: hypothetical protein QOJ11_100 [Frankiales bacterium]|jgi:hypothetical protein|nr:hypothetical protein [Frankiales bacterium]
MSPNPITLAQAGLRWQAANPVSPATVRIIPSVPAVPPAVTAAEPPAVLAVRPPSAASYFGLFRSCDCGHSSAWHTGAFGDAWRAGEQVRGGCEAAVEDGAASDCHCTRFRDPGLAR